jgi:FkbM family methyltransferase
VTRRVARKGPRADAISSLPALSVVVPTFNRARSLERLLGALCAGDAPVGGMEVVVVDDGSSDDTAEVAARAGVRYTRQANAGAASARERGWRESRAPLIAFIDDDCVPAPDAMTMLVAALNDADAVGAGMRPLAATGLISGFVAAEGLVNHRLAANGHIRYLVTAGFAVRRSALESIGGFDLAFAGAAGEDVDLSLRLKAAGYRLGIEPRAVIYHEHRTRLRQLVALYYRRAGAYRRLSAKHRGYRAETAASIATYFSPRAWMENYRRYRHESSVASSLAFLGMRAAVTLPYVAGMLRSRGTTISTAHRGAADPVPLSPHTSPSEDIRRLRDSIALLRNWPTVLSDVVLQRLGRHKAEQLLITRAGTRIRCHNDGLSRSPVFQVFSDDEYSLSDFAKEHSGERLNIVDIGAHIGAFALRVCELLPGARITSYEPSPSSFHYLEGNVRDNGLEARITCVPKGVGGETGSLTLYEATEASCLSSTVASRAPRSAQGHVIPSVSFDDVMAGTDGDVDLLKIDCEGGEYEIVRGSRPESWRRVRRVVMERHAVPGEPWDELRRRLEEAGLHMLGEHLFDEDAALVTFERRGSAVA